MTAFRFARKVPAVGENAYEMGAIGQKFLIVNATDAPVYAAYDAGRGTAGSLLVPALTGRVLDGAPEGHTTRTIYITCEAAPTSGEVEVQWLG